MSDEQQQWPLAQALEGLDGANADEVLGRFVDHVAARGLSLYPAQEEAILEVVGGRHVILNTPTGSGKSLVATAMVFKTLAQGGRVFYTCPIKALVSEKFFALCQDFGPDRVGMLTGDASINRDAPVICCTAEILMNMALREAENANIHSVIMDEFHYYGDRDRGVAWQIPLLLLEKTTFLLMTATLGNPDLFAQHLRTLTGQDSAIVRSNDRPVPLDYIYSEVPLHEQVERLFHNKRCPIYLVNFTQRAAAEQAQNLMSINLCTKEEKQAIGKALEGVAFDTPYGKELQRFVRHGVGVHHAGLLPKYRLMVEKLSQGGHLRVISGTDTLGVGVNIPIRTVLFTKLCKYDGAKTSVLSVREFKQISGRAGRKGFDDAGSVVVQAPEHVIENLRIEQKKQAEPGRHKKLQKAKAPEKGFVYWDRQTFDRLVERLPEDLPSRFNVTHSMMVNLLAAQPPVRGGGYGRLVMLIARSHGTDRDRKAHRRLAAQLFRSLRHAGVVRVIPVPMARGHTVEVAPGLQKDFSLNHTLSLWLVETLGRLDPQSATYALDALTLVESVLENPEIILIRQADRLKREKLAELKAQGVEYEERVAALQEIEYPKPNADFIYQTFNAFSEKHPWVGSQNIRPKSVARDMWEQFATFHQYIRDFDLARNEGLLLRYISDAYKTLVQTVPDEDKDDALLEIIAFLRGMIRGVDSSLVEEWESLKAPSSDVTGEMGETGRVVDLATQTRMLSARIRTETHHLIKALSIKDYEDASACLALGARESWPPQALEAAMAPYYAEQPTLRMDHEARSPRLTRVTQTSARTWDVQQTLLEPEGEGLWFLDLQVDLTGRLGHEGPLLNLRRIGT